MLKMTFAEYDRLERKFEMMANPTHNYGLTEADVIALEAEPEKFMHFAMYLLTRDWYKNPTDEHQFDNLDAMKSRDVAFRLTTLLYDTVELYDEEAAA